MSDRYSFAICPICGKKQFNEHGFCPMIETGNIIACRFCKTEFVLEVRFRKVEKK